MIFFFAPLFSFCVFFFIYVFENSKLYDGDDVVVCFLVFPSIFTFTWPASANTFSFSSYTYTHIHTHTHTHNKHTIGIIPLQYVIYFSYFSFLSFLNQSQKIYNPL